MGNKTDMSYLTTRAGFTGPAGKIGSGDPHHIDLKLLASLPIAEQVKMVDAVARQYQANGRELEFSNAAVSGSRWNPGADLSDKVDLLNRAAKAHSHSQHSGWNSLDFYVPFKGKSRFDKGAVEDASIYLPVVAGGKVRRGSGGGYGYFSEALDPQGRMIARVGHGNIDRPEKDGDATIPLTGGATSPQSSQNPEDFQGLLSGYLLGSLLRGEPKEGPKTRMKRELISSLIQPQEDDLTGLLFQQLLSSLPGTSLG